MSFAAFVKYMRVCEITVVLLPAGNSRVAVACHCIAIVYLGLLCTIVFFVGEKCSINSWISICYYLFCFTVHLR